MPTPSGRYDGALPEDFLPHLEEHITEYGRVLRPVGDWKEVDFDTARIRLLIEATGLRVEFVGMEGGALAQPQLHQLREVTLYLLDHLAPAAGAGIVWQDFDLCAGPPPNFHLARLARRERLSPGFLRLEMDCEGVAALSKGGMHFSLLLPPEGVEPVWPHLQPGGRTLWPEGAATLHRAAYTFVTLDAAAGRFSFDLFVHPGSRASQWAETAPIGAVAGISGPGGGDFPKGQNLLMAGDETALPAIRRILENSAPDRNCTVLLETSDPADRVLADLPACKSLHWIDRSAGESLWQALSEMPVPPAGESRFVWVAAEQALVRRAKAHFRATAGLKTAEGYFSAYWAR